MAKDAITVYADGATRDLQNVENRENVIGAWAYYLEYQGYDKSYSECTIGVTNQYNEITAVIMALRAIKKKDYKVQVHSDSAYVINTMNNGWYKSWMNNGWTNAKGRPVANRERWEDLIVEINKFKEIEFIKVKGHSVNRFNNLVDQLCNDSMDILVAGGKG